MNPKSIAIRLTMRFALIMLYVFCLNITDCQDYRTGSAFSQEPDSVLGEIWLETESEWVTDSRTIYVYDSIQNSKVSISSAWDKMLGWVFSSRSNICYGKNGKDSVEIISLWFNPAKEWIEKFRTEYTYDHHDNNTLITNKNFDDEVKDWIYSDKKEMFYDENGNDTMDIRYNWAVQTAWTVSYKTIYTYDENGNNILSLLYSWDQTDFNKWLLYSKIERTFDLNGNMLSSMPYSWDQFTSQWLQPQYKFDNVYDANGNLTADSSCIWNSGSQNEGQWIGTTKNEYQNNDEGALSRVLTFTGDGLGSWLVVYRTTYYYPGQQVTQVPGIIDHQIMAYPNPSRDFVTFSLPDPSVSPGIEIWDMSGRKLLETVLPDDHTVNIGFLDKGVYICKIKCEGRVYSSRIVKE